MIKRSGFASHVPLLRFGFANKVTDEKSSCPGAGKKSRRAKLTQHSSLVERASDGACGILITCRIARQRLPASGSCLRVLRSASRKSRGGGVSVSLQSLC